MKTNHRCYLSFSTTSFFLVYLTTICPDFSFCHLTPKTESREKIFLHDDISHDDMSTSSSEKRTFYFLNAAYLSRRGPTNNDNLGQYGITSMFYRPLFVRSIMNDFLSHPLDLLIKHNTVNRWVLASPE